MDLEELLLEAGADGVRACRTVEDALRVSESDGISAAVLDVRIGADSIAPVARKLAARGKPFLFYTGQLGNDPIVSEWPNCKTISKPAQPQVIVNAVAELLRAQAEPACHETLSVQAFGLRGVQTVLGDFLYRLAMSCAIRVRRSVRSR